MNSKVNCQIVNLLLNDNNEFTNQYTSFISGSVAYDIVIEDYFKSKGMQSIKIDNVNQSICFCNPISKVMLYNQNTRRSESYYEEVFIHCNDLYHFDAFVDYLFHSDLSKYINEVETLPHFNTIKDGLKNSELITEPMTNEVDATKSLVRLLSERSDETIFRALTIHFCNLVDTPKDIDSDLIHNLNEIYQKNVVENDDIFFSSDISNKLINLCNAKECHNMRMNQIPLNKVSINDYDVILNNERDYDL